MKKWILIFFSIGFLSFGLKAEEPKAEAQPATSTLPKMTTKDAKKTCKEEGKTGAELIQCMKGKKEEK